MSSSHQRLTQEPVRKVFLRYFFPSLLGMMLMSVNILIDGIFIGNGVGTEALAGVNLAMPLFSLILAMAFWIGIGGATMYSVHIGSSEIKKARSVFSLATVSLLISFVIIGGVGAFFVEEIALFLGANEDTFSYTVEYLFILFLFGWVIAFQELVSIFVRNDGSPTLSMISLGVTAIINIALNYYMIFILQLGVLGAAIATVLASFIGLLVLLFHFFQKYSNLRTFSFDWSRSMLRSIFFIGFPSFITEGGMLVFVASYNLTIASLLGTEGVAAFSVINYLHGFMFLSFFGIETALQPMISYYHGAKEKNRMKATLKIGEKTSFILGATLLIVGVVAAPYLVSLFGVESENVRALATEGIRLFFIGYVFIGFNFVYMTYFQSIGRIRQSTTIVLLRSYILLIILLWVLPPIIGVAGVWLAFPIAEISVALIVFFFARKKVMQESMND